MQNSAKHFIAVDCGSSNGKMVDVAFDGDRISIADSRPFSYEPVNVLGTMYNNIVGIYYAVLNNFKAFVRENQPGSVKTIGVTTWGGDYGLFGEDGALLANMNHHRDNRTMQVLDEFFAAVSPRDFFYETGSIFFRGIGPCQLLCDKKFSPIYDKAKTLLGTPSVLTYFLSGVQIMDETIASSLAFTEPSGKVWNTKMLQRLGLRTDIFPEICPAGTLLGKVAPNVGEFVGDKEIKVVCSAGHDTPAGLAAIQGLTDDTIFISMGTMMLVGAEVQKPIYNDGILNGDFRVVASVGDKHVTYRDVQGFWVLNQCMKSFQDRGFQYSFDELEAMARKLPKARCIINTNDPVFFHRNSDMMTRVQKYCADSGQYVPEKPEEVYRCLIDSYAIAAYDCIKKLGDVMGTQYTNIKFFNGGCQCKLLGETISECTGLPLTSGVRYATATGNVLMQMLGVGEVATLDEMRELGNRSFEMEDLTVKKDAQWDEVYDKSMKIWAEQLQKNS